MCAASSCAFGMTCRCVAAVLPPSCDSSAPTARISATARGLAPAHSCSAIGAGVVLRQRPFLRGQLNVKRV